MDLNAEPFIIIINKHIYLMIITTIIIKLNYKQYRMTWKLSKDYSRVKGVFFFMDANHC